MSMAAFVASMRSLNLAMGEAAEAMRYCNIAWVNAANEEFIRYLPCTACGYRICEHRRIERSQREQHELRAKLHRRRLKYGRLAQL